MDLKASLPSIINKKRLLTNVSFDKFKRSKSSKRCTPVPKVIFNPKVKLSKESSDTIKLLRPLHQLDLSQRIDKLLSVPRSPKRLEKKNHLLHLCDTSSTIDAIFILAKAEDRIPIEDLAQTLFELSICDRKSSITLITEMIAKEIKQDFLSKPDFSSLISSNLQVQMQESLQKYAREYCEANTSLMFPDFTRSFDCVGKLWKIVNPSEEFTVSQFKVASFLFKFGFVHDFTDTLKLINEQNVSYHSFYAFFSKCLLRVVVLQIMHFLRNQAQKHLPFVAAALYMRRKAILHTMVTTNASFLSR